jgi:hypothetical protein
MVLQVPHYFKSLELFAGALHGQISKNKQRTDDAILLADPLIFLEILAYTNHPARVRCHTNVAEFKILSRIIAYDLGDVWNKNAMNEWVRLCENTLGEMRSINESVNASNIIYIKMIGLP